jgi:hypothetical protein
MPSAEVTLRTMVLGAQDATTGHYAVTFTESTIDMAIFPKGFNFNFGSLGLFCKYNYNGFTADPVVEGDQIKDAQNWYYNVVSVEPYYILDNFQFYMVNLEKAYRLTYEA